RIFHEPIGDRLLAHLRQHHDIDARSATKISQHNDHVFRIDRGDGASWIARVFPPARPRAGAEGDAAILRFLERQDYPAERLATDEAVSTFDGSSVLVTQAVDGRLLPSPAVGPEGIEKFAIMGDLLGRLHALPSDELVTRPGGASGDDPSREGSPRQDLRAALAFLDAVDTKVAAVTRQRFDDLRDQVRLADDGQGLPEALVHGNLLHAPDHVIVSGEGPVAIQWKAAGRGPRLADFAYLMWGTWLDEDWIGAAVGAYRQHVELTDDELDRLEAVMSVRPLYLACFDWRRALAGGHQPSSRDAWWGAPDPSYIRAAATATRAAYRRPPR
ncbi:MAG TPA: aminoglycoside phosphotransferase family protein, partial [Iamia sp.]|nr:aminoglycoside phosphotransferase family protein [Iamia sp.]